MEILQRLKHLEENIKLLKEIRDEINEDDLLNSKRLEWEVRYGLFESIQIVIDISCKISSVYNLGNPKSYKECIELLEEYGYLDNSISQKVKKMIGFRNILIHEYVKIDKKKLYLLLENLDDFIEFAKKIKDEIK